jgi:pSer/pThr/pTyr-binding forkhead associated (FHA) protein
VVVPDERVSKRHVWIGPRKGRVVAADQGSTNDTFLNSLASARIQEVPLNSGDTLIICAADVARFVYQT